MLRRKPIDARQLDLKETVVEAAREAGLKF